MLFLMIALGCAPKFGEDVWVGVNDDRPLTPDSLTFILEPDYGFTSSTISYTTSEMDGEWSESLTWDPFLNGTSNPGFILFDVPDTGWVAVHGWIEAPELDDSEQLCTIGEDIEYPAGDATFSVEKSELHWGYSAHQDEVGNCYLIYDWYVGDGERVDLPWNPFN